MSTPGHIPAGEVLPLVRTLSVDSNPLRLFQRLCDGGLRPDTLLLESGDTTLRQGEKSLLCLRSALRIQGRGREVRVQALNANGQGLLDWLAQAPLPGGKPEVFGSSLRIQFPPPAGGSEEERLHEPSPIDVLRALVRGPRVHSEQIVCSPLVAGVFAYDLIGCYETLPAPRGAGSDWPDFVWLPDQMLWMHHRQRSLSIVAQVYGGSHFERSYHDAADAISRISQACVSPPPLAGDGSGVRVGASRGEPGSYSDSLARLADVETDLDDGAFATLVETLKRHIVTGDVFQIVPSRTFSMPCRDPAGAYARLRQLNPSPYMFLVNGTAGLLFGASPETALKVEGSPSRVEIRPIAGTRPRGCHADGSLDADLDSRLEAELRLDEKELAEHMMLVDLARNDVARVSEPGTRSVDRLLGVERYSHVMHLVSHVGGQLRRDLDALHAYVATMNMGTLVGAPKLKAAELLRLHEPGRRGPYGGAVGYFTADGRMDTSIVIRSAVVRDGVARVRAGAGVVYDSEPQAEAAETRKKASAVLRAIQEAG